ncbi:hypothetical protein [Lysobacter brunescens]|uniref:Uncharacterized protein n=1 Tax=Lysobacter brunescens TaxID=262323 RepID=A0ABW2YIU0_9GAMM
MNRKNLQTAIRRARDSVASIVSTASHRSAAVTLGGSALIAAGSASAQAGGGGFDAATVTVIIAAMLAAGILIHTAWVGARWALKAFGILK